MPTFDGTENYAASTVLTEAQLNALVSSIETFLNTTKLDQDNIQTGGISTANLANNAVTTAKINDDAVTKAKIDAGVVDDSTLEQAVGGELQIKDAGVTGAKLAPAIVDDSTIEISSNTLQVKDAGITYEKQEARNLVSDTVASQSNAGNGAWGAAAASVTITSHGRPILLMVVSDAGQATPTGQHASLYRLTAGVGALRIRRTTGTATTISQVEVAIGSTTSEPTAPLALFGMETPAAGTHTYEIHTYSSTSGGTTWVIDARLTAVEL